MTAPLCLAGDDSLGPCVGRSCGFSPCVCSCVLLEGAGETLSGFSTCDSVGLYAVGTGGFSNGVSS